MTIGKPSTVAAAAIAILLASPTFAATADTPASEASIRELIDLTQARKLVDNVSSQLDSTMQTSMKQALAGRPITPAQQKILDGMRAKMLKVFNENMQWSKLEPQMIDVYRRTFTQTEIEGMVSFYKTDAGKAVIAKMPLVLQNSIQLMQSQLATMAPQIQQIQQETITELQGSKPQ